MVIKIDDYEFGDDNFEYDIYVNGEKCVRNTNETGERIIDAICDDVILIRARNIVLSSKWSWLFMFFYWILSVLSGTGDRNPFGKPFDAYIQFKTNSTYIELKANKIRELNAFKVLSGKLDIDRNEFVSPKAYKIRWFVGYVIPINLLMLVVGCLFILVASSAGSMVMNIVIGVVAVCLICWNIYAIRILNYL